MATTQSNETSEAILQVRERFIGALRQQAEYIKKLEDSLKLLQDEQQQLEEVAVRLIEPLERSLATDGRTKSWSSSDVLSSICKIAAATYAEQVFALMAEEAARMNVRSVVFDVRGRAAWGSSASGFDPQLPDEALRTLVVPLNHEGPFQKAFETGEAVETSAESLTRSRNVMEKLRPALNSRILLIPVRSAGYVAAVLYAETGETRELMLLDSLKVLAEFAGAQIDRLMAISGGLVEAGAATGPGQPEMILEREALPPQSEAETREPEAASVPKNVEAVAHDARPVEPPSPPSDEGTDSPASGEAAAVAGEHRPVAPQLNPTQLSEEEQKIHRDAQRFSKLLVSEIELYNMSGVQEGRKNRDLYLRLKKDIDRSRETYEKRFSNTVAKKVDYFHKELVKRLAENDPSLLGSEYPGPSV